MQQEGQIMSGRSEKEFLMDVERDLGRLEKIKSISVRDYCMFCEKVLQLSMEILYLVDQQVSKESKGGKEIPVGLKNLKKMLLQPAIEYTPQKPSYKKVDKEILEETGKRVISQITYAWDYYIRLIRGLMAKDVNVAVFNKETVSAAKTKLKEMFDELKQNRYRWQLYEKNEMAIQERDRKQVDEEYVFINVLQNIVRTQTEKVKKARQQNKLSVNSYQLQSDGEGTIEEEKSKKQSISGLIDIKGYFQRKKKRLQSGQTTKDPISQCEQRRRFNAAALRYLMQSSQWRQQ